GHELLGRHAVEGVVDLDRRKPGGIVRQHLRRGQLLWIEAAFPFGIVVTGGSDPNHRTDDCRLFVCAVTSLFPSFWHSWQPPAAASQRGNLPIRLRDRCSRSLPTASRP